MRSRPLPTPFRRSSFRVRDALSHVGPSRLRARDLETPTRGLRVPRSLRSRGPVRVYAPLLGPTQHFSHVSAAAAWGMPVPLSARVHVSTIGSGAVMRRRGVVGHRVSAERADVHRRSSSRVSGPISAWLECAALTGPDEVGDDDLVAMGDWLVGRSCGYDMDELRASVDRRRGARGVTRIREALEHVRVGAESPRETVLRLQLAREGIRHPLLNCDVNDADGRFIGRPDLIFGRARVTVEYDGDQHRTDRKQYRDDNRRREAFIADGWRALHVSDDDLTGHRWRTFVARLRAALASGEQVVRVQAGSRSQ